MADIKQIQLPNGTTYDIVDQGARDLISSIQSGSVVWLGVTTTPLTDGAAEPTSIMINGTSVAVTRGCMTSYGNSEFIYGDVWQEFGDLGLLKALAYKDSASGSYTPAGTVTQPTIGVELNTTTITGISSVGVLPTFSASVANEVLTLGWTAGSLPTQGEEQTVATSVKTTSASGAAFNGTAAIITVQ